MCTQKEIRVMSTTFAIRGKRAILEGDLLCNETFLLEAAAVIASTTTMSSSLTTRCRVYFGLCPGGFSLVGGTIPLSRK
jgi:hypothetical protein